MKKRFALLAILALVLALALCGCGAFLSDNFDNDSLEEASRTLVQRLNDDDMAAIYDNASDSFRELATIEGLEKVWVPAHAELGDYIRVTGISLQGDGEDLAISVIAIKYTNDTITVQAAFNVDLELMALNFK